MERVRELADEATTFDAGVWREGGRAGLDDAARARGGRRRVDQRQRPRRPARRGPPFGRHAAPGPLLGTNVVAAALGRWGSPAQQAGPLAELVAGDAVAAWAHAVDRSARRRRPR